MTSPLRSTRTAPAPVPTRAPRQASRRRSTEHLRVVQPAGRRGHRLALGALVVVVVFGSLLCAAVFQAMLVTGQDKLDDTRGEIRQLEQELQRDRALLAEVQSPEHLAIEAARIGMVTPDGREWVQAGPYDTTAEEGTDGTEDGTDGSELAAPPGDTEVVGAR